MSGKEPKVGLTPSEGGKAEGTLSLSLSAKPCPSPCPLSEEEAICVQVDADKEEEKVVLIIFSSPAPSVLLTTVGVGEVLRGMTIAVAVAVVVVVMSFFSPSGPDGTSSASSQAQIALTSVGEWLCSGVEGAEGELLKGERESEPLIVFLSFSLPVTRSRPFSLSLSLKVSLS